ncbi:MAG: beta-galactosidase [Clostridia bacterium]|nr:beta-galactosidase [Clostridia bacterium]
MLYGFKKYEPRDILSGHLRMGSVSPNGDEISANSLYFTKNGAPVIWSMGEYHFSRDRAENWPAELAKMKAGGIDIVSTYLFWIYHEETEGEFDFTGDRDIRTFTEECARAGLSLFIRIGPWAHGECRNGGFPDWLVEKGLPLRTNDEAYMRYARRWYESIYGQVKGLFFKDGGPIIGVQFDNELTDAPEHLLALKRMALEIGFDAPIYTATGWNSAYGAKLPVDELIPVFGGYADAPWAKGISPLPPSSHYVFNPNRNDAAVGLDVIKQPPADGWVLPYERYPFATCELGSGLHSTHHRRYVFRPMDAYAMSLVKLGDGNNLTGYYMYHGGEHKLGRLTTLNESRQTGYPNDYPILNYDYQAPLGQYGEAREHYGLLNLIHLFTQDFGDRLAPMQYVPSEKQVRADDPDSLRYALRTDGKSGFVFINHYQRLMSLNDVSDVQITVNADEEGEIRFPPFDVKGEMCGFMPFNMALGDLNLDYATVQPICFTGDTYFFCALNGIRPVYRFGKTEINAVAGADKPIKFRGRTLVTLKPDEAGFLRRLDGKIYLGEKCNLYEMNGEIRAVEDGNFAYGIWTGGRFERKEVLRPFSPPRLTLSDCAAPFAPAYPEELSIGGDRRVHWKRIQVSSPDGFVDIDIECDAAQIYANGALAADEYYCGIPWRVPAQLLYGKTCFLAYSEMKDDFYKEW